LHTNYNQLFLADNDKNGAQRIYFAAIAFDGIHTQTYGGTTFLTHAPVGGSMDASTFVSMVVGGIRTTAAFVDKFSENTDTRGHFIGMAKLKKSKHRYFYRWICDSEI
jgi:hypothetical protein